MKRAVCLVFIAGAPLLAGCGGDDDSAPETPIVTPTAQEPTNLSKERFIREGDGICAEVNAALGSLSSGTASSASAAGQRADLYEEMVERLRSLGDPTDRAGLDEFLAAAEDIVAAQRDAEQAAQSGDDTALASAESDLAAAETTFATAADSYGFQDCGQGPTTPSSGVTAAPTAPAPAAPAAPAPVTTAPAAPAAPSPGSTGAGGGTAGTGTGGGTTGGTSGSGGVGPG